MVRGQGRVTRVNLINPQTPVDLEATCSPLRCSQPLPSGGGFSTCKTTQGCTSDTAIHVLQGGTKDSVATIRLIVKLLPVPLTQLLLFSLPVHTLSVILESGFCVSEEAWETTGILQTRGRQKTRERWSVLGKPQGPA